MRSFTTRFTSRGLCVRLLDDLPVELVVISFRDVDGDSKHHYGVKMEDSGHFLHFCQSRKARTRN